MAEQGRSHVNTGCLQPAQVDYRTLEANSYGDPCTLSLVEQLEADVEKPVTNEDEDKLEIFFYDVPPMEVCFERSVDSISRCNWTNVAVSCCILLVTAETIFAFLSNSIACDMDVLHWISEAVGHYKFARQGSATYQRLECILLLAYTVLIWCAMVFLLFLTTGQLKYSFNINLSYMLVAAGLSCVANIVIISLHLRKTFRKRKYLSLLDFICVRVQQFLHIVGNHGASIIVLIAVALMNDQPQSHIVDAVAAFILAILLICNTVSTVNKCYFELQQIVSRRMHYQTI